MNPELRRNVWLELSFHRLLAMPAAIALSAILVIATSETNELKDVALAAAYGFAALVLIWGTHLSSSSVIEEARARTWDAQRMSSIGPWAMTWGKLVGAPSYAWYGGIILLTIFVLAGWGRFSFPILRCATIMVASAVLLHALALNASVLAARKGAIQRNTTGVALSVVAMVLFFPATDIITGADQPIEWWHTAFSRIDFLLLTMVTYAAWAVLGAYRMMCSELEIRTLPWAVVAFLGFTAVYLAGFLVSGKDDYAGSLRAILLSGTAVSLVAMYFLLFSEQTGPGAWQRLLSRLRGSLWRRALEELPIWTVALAAGAALSIAAALVPASGPGSALLRDIGLAPVAFTLFAVRDAALFQFFAFARQPRRTETATLFYLVLLYWLVPGLLSALGANTVADFILPPLAERTGFATAVIAVHAVIAIGLALWRWQRFHAMGVTMASPVAANDAARNAGGTQR